MSKNTETKKLEIMREVIAVSIPIIITLGAFAMVVIIRRLEHLEKIKMIEKGMDISKMQKPHKPGGAIKFALMAVGVGIGLFVASVLDSYTSIDNEALYFAMIFICGGAGLFVGNQIADKKIKEEREAGM
ncbi:MAG: hypothetical protein KDD29_03460 [Flavobacteriales bacterium]|nr:hypothetical protein [Flavobacteriales bacterium]MCB9334824.1 hypothetical protein [Flavobacteriales bacterium]